MEKLIDLAFQYIIPFNILITPLLILINIFISTKNKNGNNN